LFACWLFVGFLFSVLLASVMDSAHVVLHHLAANRQRGEPSSLDCPDVALLGDEDMLHFVDVACLALLVLAYRRDLSGHLC
jgi:hypothetical protein